MDYPGWNIKRGEKDANIVKAVKIKLNEMLVEPSLKLDPEDPSFGPKMLQAVKLFQARHFDANGQPLEQDGVIGTLTWAALFGNTTIPTSTASSNEYLTSVLQLAAAAAAKPVVEKPPFSNKGPEVSEYLRRAGAQLGDPWCCAFVYWCFDEAAKKMNRKNPMVKTAGCLEHWERAEERGIHLIYKDEAVENPALVKSGMIFIIDHGGGKGHTGLIDRTEGIWLKTIEGNTNLDGSRDGYGVFRHDRKTTGINLGFIDYTHS